MKKIHTHYDNLKVARNAPIEVIRAAYKSLSHKHHPDRNRLCVGLDDVSALLFFAGVCRFRAGSGRLCAVLQPAERKADSSADRRSVRAGRERLVVCGGAGAGDTDSRNFLNRTK